MAGLAAAFAGVAAGFGVNFLITPLDGVLDGDHERRERQSSRTTSISLSNLYFGIGSTIFVTFVLTFITAKLVENRLGAWDPGCRR